MFIGDCGACSFVGHLAGIMAGLLIGWGFFAWVTPFWFISSLVRACMLRCSTRCAYREQLGQGYVLLFIAVSLKTTTNVPVPFITIPPGGGGYVPPRAIMCCQLQCGVCSPQLFACPSNRNNVRHTITGGVLQAHQTRVRDAGDWV